MYRNIFHMKDAILDDIQQGRNDEAIGRFTRCDRHTTYDDLRGPETSRLYQIRCFLNHAMFYFRVPVVSFFLGQGNAEMASLYLEDAVRSGNIEIAQLVLDKSGAAINDYVGSTGQRLLEVAAEQTDFSTDEERIAMIELLISRGADTNSTNAKGQTALDYYQKEVVVKWRIPTTERIIALLTPLKSARRARTLRLAARTA